MDSEIIKALKQRIDELEKENKELEAFNMEQGMELAEVTQENENLKERILDLEACK